jgi:phosphoribosyl-dephospho-CoA transferase
MLPHTLLRISGAEVLRFDAAPPAWTGASLARAPWVVVRRAHGREIPGGTRLVPVGVRGTARNERCPAWLAPADVLECLSPEELVERRAWQDQPLRSALPAQPAPPALAALEPVAELLARCHPGMGWGPAGAVAFELASGWRTVTPESDLDLILRPPAGGMRMTAHAAAALLDQLAAVPARIDALVESPAGALALAELARAEPPYLLRTLDGARLCADPWAQAAAAA